MKIYINYNYDVAPITTAYYIDRAVEMMGYELLHEKPDEADVVINIEPFEDFKRGKKTVLWELDSYRHIHSQQHDRYYEQSDIVATASAPHYVREGWIWLPVASDPGIHRKTEEPEDYDIVFVGRVDNAVYPRRGELLDKLSERYKMLVTQSEPGRDYANQMSRGKLIFNCSASDDINMRFFEGMSIGSLVTNYLPHHWGLAQPFVHYIPYRSDDELFRVVDYYLENDEKREGIAKAARKHILNKHTYWMRLEEILAWLKYS